METQENPLGDFPGVVLFGDDPSGFIYGENKYGEILSFDTQSGNVKLIAADMEEFFTELLFGPDAARFAGQEWLEELRAAGLLG